MPGELCMPSRKDYKRPLDHINTVATLGSNFVLIFSICTPPIINLVWGGGAPPPNFTQFYLYLILSWNITFAPRGFRDILEPEK